MTGLGGVGRYDRMQDVQQVNAVEGQPKAQASSSAKPMRSTVATDYGKSINPDKMIANLNRTTEVRGESHTASVGIKASVIVAAVFALFKFGLGMAVMSTPIGWGILGFGALLLVSSLLTKATKSDTKLNEQISKDINTISAKIDELKRKKNELPNDGNRQAHIDNLDKAIRNFRLVRKILSNVQEGREASYNLSLENIRRFRERLEKTGKFEAIINGATIEALNVDVRRQNAEDRRTRLNG